MKKYGINDIRKIFINYFEERGHFVQPSYPLIPIDDHSLLLVNAGMQPLKKYFTGEEEPPKSRMVTSQKCFRTIDIDNVGHTDRHATMFEMLGNFSFGDYFKKESLTWGFDLLVNHLGLDPTRLWPTVYCEDQEAYDIWINDIGVPADHVVRLGKEDNFWEIGTGPCGPCSEIHYDRGAEFGCGSPNCKPGCDCDRYLEIWNHVFSQFDRQEDGTYLPLAKKNIDTGMGLERIAFIVQGVNSIFETDVFQRIITVIEEGATEKNMVSTRIVADHMRSTVFLIGDGVMPSNEGRGYVLRRVFRRAARHANKLGLDLQALINVVTEIVLIYEDEYQVLKEKEDYVKKIITVEWERFESTIAQGLQILETYAGDVTNGVFSGLDAFKLYDTYGFPLELTKEILAERNIKVDEAAFVEYMEVQKKRARAARDENAWGGERQEASFSTEFTGYHEYVTTGSIEYLTENEVALTHTPFYAESGGQIGDTGWMIQTDLPPHEVFEDWNSCTLSEEERRIKYPISLLIDNTYKKNGVTMHSYQILSGELKEDRPVVAVVEYDRRMRIARNHSATHLLHQALRDELGNHVEQAGSLVSDGRLRFDFSHYEALTDNQLERIERSVNHQIFAALSIGTEEMSVEEAKKKGAMALFGEKYGAIARVVSMGSYSIELCGGTHLDNTSQIGVFKIISESGIASGVRRIEATTGDNVYELMVLQQHTLETLAQVLKSPSGSLVEKATQLVEELKENEKEKQTLKEQVARAQTADIINSVISVGKHQLCRASVGVMAPDMMRILGDQVMTQLQQGVLVLASTWQERVHFLVMVSDQEVAKGAHAGRLAKIAATETGGGGGGRPAMAQASGKKTDGILRALEAIEEALS